MSWRRSWSAVVGAVVFTQACSDGSSPDPGQLGAAAGNGPLSGNSSAAVGAAGSAPTSGGQASTAGAAGAQQLPGGQAGRPAAGGGSSGGANGGGSGGAPGAQAGSGSSAGGAGGSAPSGSGGAAGSGAGGALNNDGPCAVPSYVTSDKAPIGWASQGTGTSGGGTATPILVTTLAQLKSEVAGSTPKVIYIQGEFSPDNISIGSNKTLIGCSPGAKLQGHLGIGSGSSNVILRNLKITGYGAGDCAKDPSFDASTGCSSGADAVSVNGTAHHVWFDHCTIMDGTDGNLDITNNADFVTVSWTKFAYTPRTDNVGDDSTGAAGHRFSNLVGGSDTAPSGWPSTRPLNVTWHHDWWADGVVERQPRVRYGQNHLFNNYYDSKDTNYCVRAGIEASILLEANYFDGVDSPHEFNNSSNEKTAYIELGKGDRANTYVSTSGEKAEKGGGAPFTPPYAYQVDTASSLPASIKAQAGPH